MVKVLVVVHVVVMVSDVLDVVTVRVKLVVIEVDVLEIMVSLAPLVTSVWAVIAVELMLTG